MRREIGSEFWLECESQEKAEEKKDFLCPYKNYVLTSSGRGAISLLLQNIQTSKKRALLPAYSCHSMIEPFIKQGYQCHFYDINEDLSPKIAAERCRGIGIFLHLGYFGFPTNSNINALVGELKQQGIIVIEDITHSLFFRGARAYESDYYIGSIRKWFGIPTGGLLASREHPISTGELQKDINYASLREEAMKIKREYMTRGEEELKQQFMRLFKEAEQLLNRDLAPYAMSRLSKDILSNLQEHQLISARRGNFEQLLKDLPDIPNIEPMFKFLPKEVCPLFYPLLIKKGREDVRAKLQKERIYCPIHWQNFGGIDLEKYSNARRVYDSILSLPCDQRYDSEDIKRIISALIMAGECSYV